MVHTVVLVIIIYYFSSFDIQNYSNRLNVDFIYKFLQNFFVMFQLFVIYGLFLTKDKSID
jgi:hypothetical protein